MVLAALARNVGAGEPPLRRARRVLFAFSKLPELPDVESAHCEVAQQLATRLGLGSEVVCALGHVFERWDGRG
jgi:hypothetical protein